MAEQPAPNAREQLAKLNEDKERRMAREREERAAKAAANDAAAAERRKAAKERAELIRQAEAVLDRPDHMQAAADITTIFVGEAAFRGLAKVMSLIGASSPWWYVAVPAGLSIPGYLVAYPRVSEGIFRKFARAWSLQTLTVSVHDGVGFLLQGSKASKEQQAELQRALAEAQAQLAAQAQAKKQ